MKTIDAAPIARDFARLNQPSPTAWQEIAAGPTIDFKAVITAEDPFDMACRAWRMALDPKGSNELFERITITFVDAVERCADEAFALAHAIVEAARQKSLFEGTSDWLQKARDQIASLQSTGAAKQPLAAITALADAYLAEDLRDMGESEQASELLDSALAQVPKGASKIRSRILEVASIFALKSGDYERAQSLLLDAERLAREDPIPGRLAEIRLRQARLMMWDRDYYGAQGTLQRALDDLPRGRDLRLHLEISHDLLAARVARRDFAGAKQIMTQARWLYGHDVSDSRLLAERDRLRGRLALDQALPDDAQTFLLAAIPGLLDAHCYVDAIMALDELRQVEKLGPSVSLSRKRGLEVLELFRAKPGLGRVDRGILKFVEIFARHFGVELEAEELFFVSQESDQIH